MVQFNNNYTDLLTQFSTACQILVSNYNAIKKLNQSSILPTSLTNNPSYFYGIHSILYFDTINSSFSLKDNIVNNSDYLFTMFKFEAQCCPSSSPYFSYIGYVCVSLCDVGYYSNSLMYCQQCSIFCLTCDNNPNKCLSCKPNYIFNASNNSCQCTQVLNYQDGSCTQCNFLINYCKICSNISFCLRCQPSFVLKVNPLDYTSLCYCPGSIGMFNGKQTICLAQRNAQSCTSGTQIKDNHCICIPPLKLTNGFCK